MAEFLGLGLTHYPLLSVADNRMADLLRWTLTDPSIPEAEKDPANWPELTRREWSNDGGTAAAAGHRKELREHLAHCRGALDAFQPDVVLVWGDDQYENFQEDGVAPFTLLAYEGVDVQPWQGHQRGANLGRQAVGFKVGCHIPPCGPIYHYAAGGDAAEAICTEMVACLTRGHWRGRRYQLWRAGSVGRSWSCLFGGGRLTVLIDVDQKREPKSAEQVCTYHVTQPVVARVDAGHAD